MREFTFTQYGQNSTRESFDTAIPKDLVNDLSKNYRSDESGNDGYICTRWTTKRDKRPIHISIYISMCIYVSKFMKTFIGIQPSITSKNVRLNCIQPELHWLTCFRVFWNEKNWMFYSKLHKTSHYDLTIPKLLLPRNNSPLLRLVIWKSTRHADQKRKIQLSNFSFVSLCSSLFTFPLEILPG